MSTRAWLGEGASFVGENTFAGRVRIDGHWTGTVRSDDFIEVGPQGRVTGTVQAPQVLVEGVVDGQCIASERLTVAETGTVLGLLQAPWLDARLGCRLEGTVAVMRGSTDGADSGHRGGHGLGQDHPVESAQEAPR